VQKVFGFDRFPVTRFHKEGTESILEILDLRFSAGANRTALRRLPIVCGSMPPETSFRKLAVK